MKLELDSSDDAQHSGRESFQGKTDQETNDLTKRPTIWPRDQQKTQRPRDQHSGVRKTSQDISTPLGGKIQLLCQKQVTKSGTCVPESHKCNIRPILGAEITDGIIRDVPLPIHTRTMNTYQRNEWWQRGTFVEQKKFLWPDFWLKDIYKKVN